jgi:hypothetical protein
MNLFLVPMKRWYKYSRGGCSASDMESVMDDTESMVPVVPVLDVRRLRWLLVDRWRRTPLDSESVGVSGGGCAALLVAREMRTPTQPRGVKQ